MIEKREWVDQLSTEVHVSPEVEACGEKLESSGVWWQASTNYKGTEVFSCRHAVKFRQRLGSGGNGGIPLWAELKSIFGIAVDPPSGTRMAFAAHTRANTQFDERLLLDSLGLCGEAARIETVFRDEKAGPGSPLSSKDPVGEDDPTTNKTDWYGKVNPFNVDRILQELIGEDIRLADVPQILDESLKLDGGIPSTVMSNLGSRTTAFEVEPADLVSIVMRLSPQSCVARVSEPCRVWLGLEGEPPKDYWLQFPPPRGPKVGILTGNSPESGMTLWKDMLECLRSHFGNLSDALMPEVHIHSLPEMGLSMELVAREERVWKVVREGISGLLEAGCEIVTVACNTTIYFEPRIADLCKESGARFVSIAEACLPAVLRALEERPGNTSVGLVGIGSVIDLSGTHSGYKRHFEREGIRVVPCPADKLGYAVKSKGTKHELVTEFRRIVGGPLLSDVAVVILALTEVSMVYREHIAKASKKYKSGKVFIDPLRELGSYLSFLYLMQGYTECAVCQIPKGYDIKGKLRQLFGWSYRPTEEVGS